MARAFSSLVRDDEGQALVEYGMIIALIAVVCYTAVALLGTNINNMLTNLAGDI
jgi:pilus assembly protein Flp/PilA